jgi:hypothetical protein
MRLWAVLAVVGVQQAIVALPGDDVGAGPWAVPVCLTAAALVWAAAVRRSWLALEALAVIAIASLLAGIVGIGTGHMPAVYAYTLLSGLALGLLLSPHTRAHVRGN